MGGLWCQGGKGGGEEWRREFGRKEEIGGEVRRGGFSREELRVW